MRNVRVALLIPSVAVASGLLVGCGAAQDALDQGAEAVRTGAANALSAASNKAVAGVVQARLADAGIALKSAPNCTNTMAFSAADASGQGVASCTATTTGGKKVTATFKGSVDTGGCDGALTIEVAGRAPIKDASVEGCRIGQVLGVAEGAEH